MKLLKQNNAQINGRSIIPESYILNMNSKDFSEEENQFLNENLEGQWILKKAYENRGEGIELIPDIKEFKKQFKETKNKIQPVNNQNQNNSKGVQQTPASKTQHETHVIQKYIEPFLIENKKCDIRCYVMIACTKPLYLLFHQGYFRRCILNYCKYQTNDDIAKMTHLTNLPFQEKHPEFNQKKEELVWSNQQFKSYALKNNLFSNERVDFMFDEIEKIMKIAFTSGFEFIEKKLGMFELFGCDIVIDQQLKPYIVEFNSGPLIVRYTEIQRQLISYVVQSSVEIALEIHEDASNTNQKISQNQINLKTFSVLYNQCDPSKEFNQNYNIDIMNKIKEVKQTNVQVYNVTIREIPIPNKKFVVPEIPFSNKIQAYVGGKPVKQNDQKKQKRPQTSLQSKQYTQNEFYQLKARQKQIQQLEEWDKQQQKVTEFYLSKDIVVPNKEEIIQKNMEKRQRFVKRFIEVPMKKKQQQKRKKSRSRSKSPQTKQQNKRNSVFLTDKVKAEFNSKLNDDIKYKNDAIIVEENIKDEVKISEVKSKQDIRKIKGNLKKALLNKSYDKKKEQEKNEPFVMTYFDINEIDNNIKLTEKIIQKYQSEDKPIKAFTYKSEKKFNQQSKQFEEQPNDQQQNQNNKIEKQNQEEEQNKFQNLEQTQQENDIMIKFQNQLSEEEIQKQAEKQKLKDQINQEIAFQKNKLLETMKQYQKYNNYLNKDQISDDNVNDIVSIQKNITKKINNDDLGITVTKKTFENYFDYFFLDKYKQQLDSPIIANKSILKTIQLNSHEQKILNNFRKIAEINLNSILVHFDQNIIQNDLPYIKYSIFRTIFKMVNKDDKNGVITDPDYDFIIRTYFFKDNQNNVNIFYLSNILTQAFQKQFQQYYKKKFETHIKQCEKLALENLEDVKIFLIKNKINFQNSFRSFDNDGDKLINFDDFYQSFIDLGKELSESQIRDCFFYFDHEQLNIKVNLDQFKKVFNQITKKSSEEIILILKKIKKGLKNQNIDPKHAFGALDYNRDDKITVNDLKVNSFKLRLNLTDDDIQNFIECFSSQQQQKHQQQISLQQNNSDIVAEQKYLTQKQFETALFLLK